MKILFAGDIVGSSGRKALSATLPDLCREYEIDFTVANAENAAAGAGITASVAADIYKAGVDVLTLGNHAWSKREVFSFIESDNRILRPANFPDGNPGKGSLIIEKNGKILGVMQLQGRIFMNPIDDPFKAADKELEYLKPKTRAVLVDIHAETTSEKCALAWYLDGRVSCVAGTHTHVQTADERILPFGTSFISDVGMTGPYEGIIGMDREAVLIRFLKQMPERFVPAQGKAQINAVVIDIDETTGKSRSIRRIYKIL